MKKRSMAVIAAAVMMLSGCMEDHEDVSSEVSYEEAAASDMSSTLSYGTGLEEISITAQTDPDPDRQVVRRKTPVRQIRGVDVNGNTLSDEFYFYRNLLSGTYKQAYDQIYSALYNGSSTVEMSVSVHSDDIADIVYSVYYDHPELFWVDSSLTYYMNNSGIVTSLTVNFNGTANDLQSSKQTFEKAAAPIVTLASQLSGDAEKVKLVHDYLTNTIQYVSGSQYNQSAYSAFVSGKTVCAGYAHAFQYCMQKLGIPAAYIVGYAGEAHAWNLLEIDGEYYSMDVTWDDPIGNPSDTYYYDYFNVTDAQLSRDHTRDPISARLPSADGTRYSFGSYFGGNAYGSDLSGLDLSADMPSDHSETFEPYYPDHSVQEEPDPGQEYIDDWSDEDWDSYWNDFDDRLENGGYDDFGYDEYDDWEDYYFGDGFDDDYYDEFYDDCYDDDYYDYDDDYYDGCDYYDDYFYDY